MHYPDTKLPKIGTTIFSVMSQLAAEHQAINLSQGFPDFDGPEELRERVGYHIHRGANQYSPFIGVPSLRQAIQEKVQRLYGVTVDADTDITVTSGASEAIFCAVSAVVRPGDEVIVLDPCYDSYEPAIELNGGVCRHVALDLPRFSINWEHLQQAISPRTRMIILNTPHNPSGATLSQDELNQLAALVSDTNILLLGDEVYEHIVFDGQEHRSLLSHTELAKRSFVVSSFGKTFHITGWKIGYCIAPKALTAELRKVHQYVTFCTSTPMQLAIADYMHVNPGYELGLARFYQEKRDVFCQELEKTRFKFTPAQGTYFQLVDYSEISDMDDARFARWLTQEAGVAAIPISVFCQNPDPEMRLVRFCFAKNEATLKRAGALLCRL